MSGKSTIEMMKLYQENVKKDITNTNSVIKLVQEKLKDCDINLNSLKQISKELNLDFANIETKINDLNTKLKSVNSNKTSLSRNSSLNSLIESLNENKLNEALRIRIDREDDDMDDIENSYIYITLNKDGTSTEEVNWAKRSSISSTASSNATYLSDDNSNDSDFGTYRSVENTENEKLIKMLLQGSILPVGK